MLLLLMTIKGSPNELFWRYHWSFLVKIISDGVEENENQSTLIWTPKAGTVNFTKAQLLAASAFIWHCT